MARGKKEGINSSYEMRGCLSLGIFCRLNAHVCRVFFSLKRVVEMVVSISNMVWTMVSKADSCLEVLTRVSLIAAT